MRGARSRLRALRARRDAEGARIYDAGLQLCFGRTASSSFAAGEPMSLSA